VDGRDESDFAAVADGDESEPWLMMEGVEAC